MPVAPQLSDIPESLTPEEFWQLMGRLEHTQQDFKQGPPSDLASVVVAMAMTDGGLLVLGVTNDREIVGCEMTQRTYDKVMRAGHTCGVDLQLKQIIVDETPLTLVGVPEVRGRIVTTTDGRLLRRVGSDCQPLIGDSLARFVRERENQSAEEQILAATSPADFDLRLINQALARQGRGTIRRDSIPRALVELGVALPGAPPVGTTIMTGAALLFGTDPTKFIPGAVVQVVRRVGVGPGPGPSQARESLGGSIPLLLDRVLEFVGLHTKSFEIVIGTHRQVISEYPTEVLREAILNALGHRDYALTGATVDVTIWDDRIEVQSPGPLPGHITVENMRDEHYSRNRRIMQVLKVLGLVEEYGEGVDRMFREMEARVMEPPSFTATTSSLTVTLRNRFIVSLEDQAWLALLGHVELSADERRILVTAKREDGITPRRGRQLLPNARVESLLAGSVAKGLLVRVGHRGGTRYVLSDEMVIRAGATGLEAQSRKRQILLDEVRARGSLSTAEGADLLGEEIALVRHLLNDLASAGLVEARGITRARRYYSYG